MSYTSVTLADLQARLLLMTESQPFWSADASRRAINEGLRIWNALTGMWKQAVTLTTVPEDPHLYVTGIMVKASRVRMGTRILIMGSLNGFDKGIANWEGTSGTPIYWAPIGLTEIMLYPKDAAPGQNSITVEGVSTTPVLVNAGDYLDLGEEEISTLLGYALHVLSIAKGITALQKTQPLRVAFYQAAGQRNALFAASDLYRKMVGYDRTRDNKPMTEEMPAVVAAVPSGSEESQ